jgi:hypothetical protein
MLKERTVRTGTFRSNHCMGYCGGPNFATKAGKETGAPRWFPATCGQEGPVEQRLQSREHTVRLCCILLFVVNSSFDSPRLGPVSFSITSTTSGNAGVLEMPPTPTRGKRSHSRRGLFDKIKQVATDVGDKIKEGAGDTASVATKAADTVTSVAVQAASTVTSAAVAAETKVAEETKFNTNEKSSPPPVNIDTKFNVFNTSIECGDKGNLSLSVDATMVAHANVTFGLVAAGTMVPPKFDTFSISGGINMDFNTTLHWKGSGNVSVVSELDYIGH